MNDRDLNRVLDAWMDLGPTAAPDRVADAVRLEVRSTRQTAIRLWWSPRRFPDMNNTVRLGMAAAVVAVAALLGYTYLIAPSVGGPSPFGDPTPTPEPTPSPIAFTQHPGGGAELEPGSYRIDYPDPISVIITVPAEASEGHPSAWYKAMFDWGPWHQSNAAALGFGDVATVAADPCDPAIGPDEPRVGPAVDDLVDALSAVPLIEVTSSEATVDGYSGVLLELAATGRPGDCVAEPVLWRTTRGDPILVPGSTNRMRVWVLDVDGSRLVIWAGEEGDSSVERALQTLIDSIRIESP